MAGIPATSSPSGAVHFIRLSSTSPPATPPREAPRHRTVNAAMRIELRSNSPGLFDESPPTSMTVRRQPHHGLPAASPDSNCERHTFRSLHVIPRANSLPFTLRLRSDKSLRLAFRDDPHSHLIRKDLIGSRPFGYWQGKARAEPCSHPVILRRDSASCQWPS